MEKENSAFPPVLRYFALFRLAPDTTLAFSGVLFDDLLLLRLAVVVIWFAPFIVALVEGPARLSRR